MQKNKADKTGKNRRPGSFNSMVYAALGKIPRGKVTTYSEIAKAIGRPKAFRQVGNACNANPDAPKVPCHRVVKSNGEIGGYAKGKKAKVLLLKAEGIEVIDGKIMGFEGKIFKFTDRKK